MAKSTAYLSAGAKLSYATLTDRTPGGYTDLVELKDLTPPKKQRDDVEISNHDSANRKKEYIPGWLGATDPTFKFIYLPAAYAVLDGFVESGTLYGFKITYSTGDTETFIAYVKDLGKTPPLKEDMTMDVTLKIDDSSIVFTPD